MIVCLVIASIIGSWCVSLETMDTRAALDTQGVDQRADLAPDRNALVGECTELHRDAYICTAAATDIPLFLSVYDTSICAEHPINCFEGGTHFANGTPTSPEWYGLAAACPTDWTNIGIHLSLPLIPLELTCLDTGGRITPMYREVWVGGGYAWRWVIVIDVYWPQGEQGWPWWSLLPHTNWQMTP